MPQMLKICAYDRPGVLDRIAGLIRRKGWNIQTLVAADMDAGLAQIDVALLGRNVDIQVLGEYLSEMDVVESFEECTTDSHILREMLLFCLHQDERELVAMEEALQQRIRQSRLVREAEGMCYLEFCGSPREVNELMQVLRAYKVRCARTGALALALTDKTTQKGV